jgi:hypothetical protein
MEPIAWYRVATPVIVYLILIVVACTGNVRFRFAVMGVTAGICYGALQDQISARLCPEYFTIFHPPIPELTDPTLLGLTWGFLGTWWAGLFLGYIAGLIATLSSRPKFAPCELVRPLLVLMGFIAAIVAISGGTVWWYSEMFGVSIDPFLGKMLPQEHHRALLVVACYHFVGYVAAFGGSLVLFVWIWRERSKRSSLSPSLKE